MDKVFHVLRKLEVSRYPNEKTTVGGYGAGIAAMLNDNSVFSDKVGKTADSPVSELSRMVKPQLSEANVLVGHVRFPSSEFLDTIEFKEAAQPYLETFEPESTIVCVHNGRIGNYRELRQGLKGHVFESEKVRLIDSEVIAHYFGSLLQESDDVNHTVNDLLCALQGKTVGSIALLHMNDENAFLHILHKGWSRGLTVWSNDRGEVIFCSRPEPVVEELKETLAIGRFTVKAVIELREDASLKLSFPVAFK